LNAPIPPEKPAQFGVRGVFFIVEPGREMLTELAALNDNGAVKSIVFSIYSLADARKAYEAPPRKAAGRIVLQIR
jgi:hypothetical protein